MTPTPRLYHRPGNLDVMIAIKRNTGSSGLRSTTRTLYRSHHSPPRRVFHAKQLGLAVSRVVLDDFNDKTRPSCIVVIDSQPLNFYVSVVNKLRTLRAGNTIGTVCATDYTGQAYFHPLPASQRDSTMIAKASLIDPDEKNYGGTNRVR